MPCRFIRFRPLRSRALLLGMALGVVAGGSQADISRQVDKDGIISFSNTPAGGKVASKAPRIKPRTAPGGEPRTGSTRYDQFIREAAALYQIPEELVRAVIRVESGFNPSAVSPKNARGLMQLIPATADRMMVTDIFDPRQNIFGGVRYLRVLANLFNGNLELTIAAYNAGEHAVMRYGGIPPYPETQDYVVKVLSHYRQYAALRTR